MWIRKAETVSQYFLIWWIRAQYNTGLSVNIFNTLLVWQLGEHKIGGQTAIGLDLRNGHTSDFYSDAQIGNVTPLWGVAISKTILCIRAWQDSHCSDELMYQAQTSGQSLYHIRQS